MTELNPASLARFVRSVAMLALSFDSQVKWLESLGMGSPEFADELALELEDGVRLSQQFEEVGWISAEVRSMTLEIDALLAERSGPDHSQFWGLESLRESPDWDRVRDLALRALTAL